MLTLIVQHSEAPINFVLALQLALYRPQIRHLLEIVDALIVCNQGKTLSGLSHLFHRSVDPKALADFFQESPWSIEQIGQPRKKFMLAKVLELAQREKRLSYRSKCNLAREMLLELEALLPAGSQVLCTVRLLVCFCQVEQSLPAQTLAGHLRPQSLVTEIKKQPQRVEAILQAFLLMRTAGT